MKPRHHLCFPPFYLDLANETLRCGTRLVPLRPKALAVLRYLAEHSQRLVTREELLKAIWQRPYVSEGLLRGYIRELRRVLGDEAKAPRFIETASRRGYRFIAPVTTPEDFSGGDQVEPVFRAPSAAHPWVGRAEALAHLQACLDRVRSGVRQVVFVTGEAGIGKTTLVQAFLERARGAQGLWVLEGQCVEHYGAGEALLPLLEALGQGCRGSGGERIREALRRYAPTWLLQLPWLVSPEEREALQRELFGATQQRLLREFCELLEALSAERPLVLVLEDLHWSDHATLDLLSVLARRRERAPLLVLGTYRPLEVILRSHPLRGVKQDLQIHELCRELPLELLTPGQVADYLAVRFPDSDLVESLAEWIYRRTEGHPLFMGNLVEYLIARGRLVQAQGRWAFRGGLEELEPEVPENLGRMIEQQIAQLRPEHQRLLEVASLAGAEFSAALLAAALAADLLATENACAVLARRGQLLRPAGVAEWPDGTVAGRYGFLHAFYPEVLYQRLAPARRVQLHQRLGACLEAAYGARASEIAAELALHFEEGRDAVRAVTYLSQAAEHAARRYAHHEAIGYLSRALALVGRLPEAERTTVQMRLLEQRGLVRRAMADMAGATEDFEAMLLCARDYGILEAEARALLYLAIALAWIDRSRCLAVVDQAEELSARLEDGPLRAYTRGWCAYWNFLWRGFRDRDAEACAAAVQAARRAGDRAQLSGLLGRSSYFQSLTSDYRAACTTACEGMEAAAVAGDAFDHLTSRFFLGWALLHLGEWGEMRRTLNEGVEMAERNGNPLWALLFRLELAALRLEAFDFKEACALAEEGIRRAQEYVNPYGEMLGTLLLGLAYLGHRHYPLAFQYLGEMRARFERERIIMDWTLCMPLSLGCSEYWLAQKELGRARMEAEQLCSLASMPGERTYLALGKCMLAKIALAEGEGDRAEAELSRALDVLEGAEVPLAAWRVYATAAEFNDRQGRAAEAEAYWNRSAAVIHALADSLEEADPLRQSLLTAPPVQAILGRVTSSEGGFSPGLP